MSSIRYDNQYNIIKPTLTRNDYETVIELYKEETDNLKKQLDLLKIIHQKNLEFLKEENKILKRQIKFNSNQ
jgi:hypothetical protein